MKSFERRGVCPPRLPPTRRAWAAPLAAPAMLHDLLVCGINEPGFRSRCPGCQREEEEESLRKLAILKEARQLREELDLPRDPCVLDRRRRAEVLLWLLDIRKTAQEHPDWAQSLQAVVMHILPRKT